MAFESLRARFKKAFGFGGSARTVLPRSRGAQYVQAFGGDVRATLISAIERKQPVSFYYDDKWQPDGVIGKLGMRIGNPHALWVGDNGTTYLHMYVDPQSASATGDLPGWRTFIIGRIQWPSILELGTRIFGRPIQFVTAPDWNPAYYSGVGTPIALIK